MLDTLLAALCRNCVTAPFAGAAAAPKTQRMSEDNGMPEILVFHADLHRGLIRVSDVFRMYDNSSRAGERGATKAMYIIMMVIVIVGHMHQEAYIATCHMNIIIE